ncbi:MAG: hypothetical protein NDI63_13435 [Pseudobdellovibrio sp.]|nr:hypothetical protein [Pseudobdellovibrio sp.]
MKHPILNVCKILFICIFFVPVFSFAVNNRTTYQAKIIKPDGFPLEAVNVNFKFTILDPSASCVLYSEEYSAVNMQNTGGLIFFSLGAGNRTYPSSGATTLEYVLDNSVVSFACETPGLYVPTSADNRKIVMQFNDGNGWQTLPAMAINSVPYAMYAGKSDNAVKLNGKSDSAFVEYSTLASLSCNSATHAITFNGASFSCIAVDSSGTAVTSSTIVAALGYTPAQGTSFTSLDSTVSSVSSAVYSVSSTVSNLNSSVTSLSNSVAASFAAISSSQWQNIAGGIKYASGTVTIGDAANNALMTLYTPDSGSVSHGLVLIDRNAGYGSWQNPSGLDGVSADSSGTVTGWGQLYFNYYSSGSIDFNRGGGYSKFNGGVAIGMPMPAARLHIGAGTSSTAPLRFVAGTLLTSAAAGAIEYDGTDYYFTDNSNTRRSLSAIAASGVTSAGIISSLGYTPADNASVTSLTSTVASSFTTLTNSVNTTGSSITTLTSTVNTLSTSITNLTAAVSGIATGAKVARFATLANITLSGLQTIDGSAVAAGDRVLVKNQTLRRNNGLYIAAAGAWTRAPELDTWTEILGAEVYVVEGLSNQGMAYMANTTNINGTLNTTNIEWTVRGSNYWNTNIAFGLDALTKNISGYDNAAFGNYSQSIVTTGSENTGVGNYTLEDLTTGNKNTAVGTAAMTGVSSGSLNTALGYRALASMSTGDGNIGIGANAGWLITTGSNNVVIGSNTGSSIATSSNNILLSDGQGNERMRITSSGAVGIGTSSPVAALQVMSTAVLGDIPQYIFGGTGLYLANDGGDPYNFYRIDGWGNDLGIIASSLPGAAVGTSISFNTAPAGGGINAVRRMTITENGNVGIGPANPSYLLDVQKNSGGNLAHITASGDDHGAYIFGYAAGGYFSGNTSYDGTNWIAKSTTPSYIAMDPGGIELFSSSGVVAGASYTPNSRMKITTSGNIGIGTTAPAEKLDVSGTITMSSSSESISTYVSTGTSYTIADTSLNIRRLTLSGNATVTLPAYAPSSPKVFTLTVFVKQDGSGSRTLSFTGAGGTDSIKWDSGLAPSISTTANKITILQFTKPSDETVWYGSKVWQED